MNRYKMGFVILHYCTAEMTMQSVDTLERSMEDENYAIVVVDNASYNGTGKQLEEHYRTDEKVTVLLSKENLGFAKGNNLGYAYAKKELGCDFICVMNNDVMIGQKDFMAKVYADYEQCGFAVEGPHIQLKNGQENAMYYEMAPVETLIKERNGYIRRLKHAKSRLYGLYKLCDLFLLKLRIFLGKIHLMEEFQLHEDMTQGVHERHTDLILHGCCLIFSPDYLARFEDAFLPDTFMFREEELLYLRCKKNGLLIVYNPKLEILHLEDVATDFIYQTNRKKEIFNLENQIASMKILIQKLQEE